MENSLIAWRREDFSEVEFADDLPIKVTLLFNGEIRIKSKASHIRKHRFDGIVAQPFINRESNIRIISQMPRDVMPKRLFD